MNDNKLKQLVAEAVALDRDISRMSERLTELKDILKTEAESRFDQAQPTEGGGTTNTFEGADGCICRVTTSAATLKSSVKGEGKDIEKVREAAGNFFTKLFDPTVSYKPVANFREEAEAFLGKQSRKLIKLCENPGRTSVAFETKDTVNAG
jgi:hypothetical protein